MKRWLLSLTLASSVLALGAAPVAAQEVTEAATSQARLPVVGGLVDTAHSLLGSLPALGRDHGLGLGPVGVEFLAPTGNDAAELEQMAEDLPAATEDAPAPSIAGLPIVGGLPIIGSLLSGLLGPVTGLLSGLLGRGLGGGLLNS
jgi:hypothetical protein